MPKPSSKWGFFCVHGNQKYLCQKEKPTRENVMPTTTALLSLTTLFIKSSLLLPVRNTAVELMKLWNTDHMNPVRSQLSVLIREPWDILFKTEKAHRWIKVLALLPSDRQYYHHHESFFLFPFWRHQEKSHPSYFLCWIKNNKKNAISFK